MKPYQKIAEINQKSAFEIIQELMISEIWSKIGARVNLVGSLKMGLLSKHLDIDFHIYTPTLDVLQSFKTIGEICKNPNIIKADFINLANSDEKCLEWHLQYCDISNQIWQIDIIQIKSDSKYDGYFENVAKKISDLLTPETKDIILKLKYETPDNMKISGIEYYKAVLQDNITKLDDFYLWRKKHSFNGIIEW